MLKETIDNISFLLGLEITIIPNLITIIVSVILISISLKSALAFKTIVFIYGIAMSMLEILGIESPFNIITIFRYLIEQFIDLISWW